MARSTPWVFLGLFLALPLLAVAIDLLWLSAGRSFPWLTLLALVWFGAGLVVGLAFLPTEPPLEHEQ